MGRSETSRATGLDWFDAAAVIAVLLFLLITIVGLVAALIGVMTPVVVGVLSAAGIAAGVLILRKTTLPRVRWATGTVLVGALVVIVGTAVLNARFAAEHLLTNRDPGVYITTARWLATRGTLLVDGAVGAFAGVPGIDGISQGHYVGPSGGLLYTQFQHGLAVILAIGRWIGGDRLLLKMVGLLSGGVVAAFFLFSRAVLRSWWALAATVGVAVNLVVVHFGRDAYSELPLMIFLYGGLWLLDRALSAEQTTDSLLAGLVLGATAMVRIDAWMILAGLFAFLFFDLWATGAGWRHRVRTVTVPVLIGVAVTGGIGVIDLLVASPRYLHDLMPNVYRIAAVLVGVVGAGVVLTVIARPTKWMTTAPGADRRRRIGSGVAILIVAGSLFLYFVRPVFFVERSFAAADVIEYLQRLNGLALDGSRRYWELSMRWQAWYLGVVGLAIGVAGWAWTAREVIRGRLRRIGPFLFMFSLVTIAFLWRPANTPDHLWMMRRFLSITIPGFVLLAFVGIQDLIPVVRDRWGRTMSVATAWALAAAMIVPPAVFTMPLIRSTTQVGMYGVTREICGTLGDDAAVLVISKRLRSVYEPTLRAFCEVPAAGAALLPERETLGEVAAVWNESGRTLYVASMPTEDCTVAPIFSTYIWYPKPERTLLRRPSTEVDERFGISIYRADDFTTGDPEAWAQCIDPLR